MKQKIFVIGDSISMHYGPFLERLVEDRFSYSRKGMNRRGDIEADTGKVNGGDSSAVLAYLSAMAGKGFKTDVLLLNCGLHDVKTDPQSGKKQVGPALYRRNLLGIAKLAKKCAGKTVWLRTTPVYDDIHNSRSKSFFRCNRDVLKYNRIADKVFAGAEISMIDLYSFTRLLGRGACIDHVHFSESARKLQASFIAYNLFPSEESGSRPRD